jgi:hypothetical protein
MAEPRIFAPLAVSSYASLIPVPVTGIQALRVRAANGSADPEIGFFASKDLGAPDSCEKHRNDGGNNDCPSLQRSPCA